MSDSIGPSTLNLVFSGAILGIGLVAYWFFHPEIFEDDPYTERGFEFWQFKWLMFVMIWALFKGQYDPRFALAAADLNSLFAIGFALAFLGGKKYLERRSIVTLVFLFGLLFSWNFCVR